MNKHIEASPKNDKSFTLVELLIVIVILGILAAVRARWTLTAGSPPIITATVGRACA